MKLRIRSQLAPSRPFSFGNRLAAWKPFSGRPTSAEAIGIGTSSFLMGTASSLLPHAVGESGHRMINTAMAHPGEFTAAFAVLVGGVKIYNAVREAVIATDLHPVLTRYLNRWYTRNGVPLMMGGFLMNLFDMANHLGIPSSTPFMQAAGDAIVGGGLITLVKAAEALAEPKRHDAQEETSAAKRSFTEVFMEHLSFRRLREVKMRDLPWMFCLLDDPIFLIQKWTRMGMFLS